MRIDNDIREEGAKVLSQALKRNSSLTRLNLNSEQGFGRIMLRFLSHKHQMLKLTILDYKDAERCLKLCNSILL